jgi:hypothetical protein
MFNNLAAGDLITSPAVKGQLIVLKTRGERGEWKHLGKICGCGNHVDGIPYLFQWNDEKARPSDKNGKEILVAWVSAQVDKDALPALAKKFEGLAVNDDTPNYEVLINSLMQNLSFKRAIELGHYSNADFGVTVVTMIRAVGGTLSDEQAALIASMMDTHAVVSSPGSLNIHSALFRNPSSVKH